ncbi:LysE family translocator [Pseudomonas berkeleyensis]|uniref:LysE family translocator n=1 Tax=Pseudomonas berkeleyensis TaxID=2726956 RepID=A0A7G5DPR6_9PSED|nr:LysE family translocator [Pseudomonas berkeleyensis]QMV63741.1 LysE family translocator [Pseudomonas berkeleyensis]WSO39208.1 LysE family translocator [Pseudomonas berkeleyensis]
MDWHLLLLFSAAFTAAVAVPGPNVAFAVAQALKHGVRATLPGAFGFGLATAVHATVVLLGVGLLIHDNRWVLTYLRWGGGIYLAYLAFGSFFATSESSDAKTEMSSQRKMFADSFLVSLTNPKGWLASLLIYPGFISPHFSYAIQAVALSLTAMIISLSIYGGYMFLAHKARAAFDNKAALNKVTGVIYATVALCLVLLPY